jgi:NodT family efflux transporter outer membrane factor (OMF) lipoprotein
MPAIARHLTLPPGISGFSASMRFRHCDSSPARRRLGRGWVIGCWAFTLSACSLGPQYRKPDMPVPAAWHGSELQTSSGWPSVTWWRNFASPQLDALIEQARQTNDDLAAAIARVREADAQARIAGAALLPTLDASAQAARERTNTAGSGAHTFTQYGPQLSAAYEIDFWGKNRAVADAARAAAAASRYDRATVELTVMSGVANTYFQVLALRDRLAIAQSNLNAAQTILSGLQLEQQSGTANALDVAQQTTTVATLYASIPPLKQQLQQATDALAILVGRVPEDVDIRSGSLADLAQPAVGAGLPSQLLARRPDIAAAEAQLVAANADVAAARAAFFPSIDLTASGGYASNALADLFNPANAVFSLAAGLTQPIFEGGALQGQSDYAKARYSELLADYHKTVISAFGNVEDALTGLQQTAEQQQRQEEAAAAARRAYEFAQAQLRAGTINVLTLLNTQSALFTAEDALSQVKLAHLQALVNLFNALGGGWQQT